MGLGLRRGRIHTFSFFVGNEWEVRSSFLQLYAMRMGLSCRAQLSKRGELLIIFPPAHDGRCGVAWV